MVFLGRLLSGFHQDRFTGIVCCQPLQQNKGIQQYFILFKLGEITYGSSELPTIDGLFDLLKSNLQHPLLKMALQMAKNRADNPNDWAEIIDKASATRIVSWEQVEQVIHDQTLITLKRLMQGPGMFSSDPNAKVEISFGDDRHSLPWDVMQQTLSQGALTTLKAVANPAIQPVTKAEIGIATKTATRVENGAEPVRIDPPSPRIEPIAPPQPGFTVLSVDDSPIVQKMIQRALQKECPVVLANNALSALKILNSSDDIALVLLDVNMPGIDGLEFCRTVRSIPKFKDLPVIMLTANEGNLNKLRGQIAGSTLYLTKPVDDQKLIEIVRKYSALAKLSVL